MSATSRSLDPTRDPTRPPAGNGELENFVRRHQTSVWRRLRALGCSAADADDLTQEAFLVALQRERPSDDAAARAFLQRTAAHLWLRRRRDDTRRAEKLLAAADELWQSEMTEALGDDGDAWLADLAACVESLPDRSRRALDLFYRDGCSREELGTALGVGSHGARTLLQRVRAALRNCINRRRQRR